MIKHKNIQRAAKVMLSALLVNAMFAVPAVHAEQKPVTTSNIKLNRVIPHYAISSPSMVHLLESSKSFNFHYGDDGLLHSLFIFGKPLLYIPSDGFLRIQRGPILHNTIPLSTTSSNQNSSDASRGLNVSSVYTKTKLKPKTLNISLVNLIKYDTQEPMATIRDDAKREKTSDNIGDHAPVINMKYKLHNASMTSDKGVITLYPYEETKYNYMFAKTTVKHIPASRQKYYPITLKLIRKHPVVPTLHQKEIKERRLHKRSHIKSERKVHKKHIQKHHHKRHMSHKIRSGHVPY